MAGTYKNFIRLLEKWPIDSSKKRRDIGIYIREQIKLNLSSGRAISQVDQEKCDRAFYSIKRLVDNHYKNRYFRTRSSTSTGLNSDQCKHVLSDEFLEHLEQQRSKVFITFFNKKIVPEKK